MNKTELAQKIQALDGLSNEDKCALLELLSAQKKYGLVWEDKPEEAEQKMLDHLPVLKEVIDRAIISDNPDAPNHILIEGDNLEALTALSYTHPGKIDVIYIDPPYNTGKADEFKYNDKFVDNEDDFRHSKWLSFMEKRLELAKKLLTEQGMIFISIDDNEVAQLKILCDEVFGENNRISTHHIQVRYAEKSLADGKSVKPVMEYVLIYAKNANECILNLPKEEYTDASFIYEIKENADGKKIKYDDGTEVFVFAPGEWRIEKKEKSNMKLLKETWVSGTIYSKMSYGQVVRKYIEPRYQNDGLGCLYKVIGRGDDGLGYRYYVGPAKKNSTRCKMYSGMPLSRVKEIESGIGSYREIPISNSIDFAPDFGNIVNEGGVPFNSGKKPVKMLKELINYHKNKNAIVLDFFAGSGSTAQAVLELNKQDEGNRHFILCTNNENNICRNITYKRISNVIYGNGKNKPLQANMKYYKTDYVPRINNDDENIQENLLKNIKNLIQLENGINIDDKTIRVILNEEEIDRFSENEEKIKECEKLYISSDILLTAKQVKIFKDNNIDVFVIPEYYFDEEIKEVQ